MTKATLNTPNTLFLAVWTGADGAVILGSLRTATETLPVLDDHGPDAWELLLAALADVDACRAEHVVIYTNDAKLAETYRPPVRLEPTAPDRRGLYRAVEWLILYRLLRYQSWQVIETTGLPNAKQRWEEHYGRRN